MPLTLHEIEVAAACADAYPTGFGHLLYSGGKHVDEGCVLTAEYG